MSKKIIKPIPNSKLHKLDDAALDLLASLYRGKIKMVSMGKRKHNIQKCAKKIQNICIILGYRSAIDCLEINGD